MRIKQLSSVTISEAIKQPLVSHVVRVIKASIKKWAGKEVRDQIHLLNLKPMFDSLRELIDTDETGDKSSKLRDDIWQKLCDRFPYSEKDASRRIDFTYNMRADIEYELQKFARETIETRYGKIDDYDHSRQDDFYDSSATKKNLYWLQHILVHIRTDRVGKHGIKNSGGHFSSVPFKAEYSDSHYANHEMNWNTDLGVGIVLYASSADQYSVARSAVMDLFHEELFGEPEEVGYFEDNWLTKIVPTFLHELTHLEQHSRAKSNNSSYRQNGITYTPNPSTKPKRNSADAKTWMPDSKKGSDRKNSSLAFRSFKPGARGNPDHLTDIDYDNADRMTDYYGTAHEIEAHAVSLASHIVMDHEHNMARARYPITDGDRAIRMNDFVIEAIRDLKNGWQTGYTYERYKSYFKDFIPSPGDGLSKVDIGKRKVWRIFLTKVIKHLESYLTEVPDNEWDEPKPNGFKRLPTNKPHD